VEGVERGTGVGGSEEDEEETRVAEAIRALHLVEVLLPCCARGVAERLASSALSLVPRALRHGSAPLRHLAARCLACLAAWDAPRVMAVVVREVLPLLEETAAGSGLSGLHAKLGGAEAAYRTIAALRDEMLLPYAVLLVSPVLAGMSDAHAAVREACTRCFASLLKVLPAERAVADPPGLCLELAARRRRERALLEQLWDPSLVEPFPVTANITAVLRPYQVEGVNWLGFLARYRLHGILCDDMGLGKTLQTIAVVASHVVNRRARYRTTRQGADAPLPSLIVCPSTLVQHWCHEIAKYSPELRAVAYLGAAGARQAMLAALLGADDVLVLSYEALRNDAAKLLAAGLAWNFAVLDEGHIVKNPKSKTAVAVKQVGLCARHRLILTGTPIQNNVLELWGLFDFLMPSFLGSEAHFNHAYSKPILASGRDLRVDPRRFSKTRQQALPAAAADDDDTVGRLSAPREGDEGEARAIEAADAALDKLHRQVLPFMLRRTKQQVLDDLPPKIIQDVLCPMSALQRELYAAYASAEQQALARLESQDRTPPSAAAEAAASAPKALSVLLYLKRVANHPLLVLGGHGRGEESGDDAVGGGRGKVDAERSAQLMAKHHPGAAENDVAIAPKMLALRQLLRDCGINPRAPGAARVRRGGDESEDEEREMDQAGESAVGGVGGHRVLIFSQMKAMLDLIERDLLHGGRGGVAYLRLDGATPVQRRFAMQLEFNADPTIKVMLLTTHVGGLGLTLTGADTVIFVDHDWNPMRDLQAMDRAHRIGQTRTVNVYRLIAQGSLEERIMGLQSFKLNVANTVVSHDNANLRTMDTSQALGFADHEGGQHQGPQPAPAPRGAGRVPRKMASAPGVRALGAGAQQELWEEDQYAEEMDLAAFVAQEAHARRPLEPKADPPF